MRFLPLLLLAACDGKPASAPPAAAIPAAAIATYESRIVPSEKPFSAEASAWIVRAINAATEAMERGPNDPWPEPVGIVRVGGRTFEFHGSLTEPIDATRIRVIRDPMLTAIWDGGPGRQADAIVRATDEWLRKNK